ncbi:restriction endonuclease subunit S [Brachyspira hampsonii]|uniref:restriction endonuclease subunit S n=1 Tax=Brachyspira hampsonii TaxID=1287055 RepID=UPI000D37D073|nr:restriction endonuclease subunit S [Brachyspira hampsonii]PTY40783.1 type I R-M system specificity subunit [Brachyspira hampsonii bv. II]
MKSLPLPQGWQEFKLKDIGLFIRGSGISKKDLSDTGIPAIRYGDIYTKYNFVIKNISSYTNSKGTELKKGDILFAGSGETAEEIGKSVAFVDNYMAFAGGDIIIFRPKINLNSIFLAYILNFGKCRKDISIMGQGHTVVHIYASSLEKLTIILPPLDEQKRIAEVLSLCDDVIENLTKLIEQKELYKKGVMQRVLSGEVRFKGFKDEWKIKKLSEISKSIKTGKLDANAMEENGQYRFYTCAREYYRINEYAFDGEALLISGNGAYVGYVHYYKGKFNAYQRTYVLMDFEEDIKYIKYYLDRYLKDRIKKEKNEGNTPYIVLSTLTDMEIKVPSLEEQKKIAGLLSVIDEDIDNLKKQLELRKQQKKGLMQRLLTGEVRI